MFWILGKHFRKSPAQYSRVTYFLLLPPTLGTHLIGRPWIDFVPNDNTMEGRCASIGAGSWSPASVSQDFDAVQYRRGAALWQNGTMTRQAASLASPDSVEEAKLYQAPRRTTQATASMSGKGCKDGFPNA